MQGETIINKQLGMYVGIDNNNKYLDMQGETITEESTHENWKKNDQNERNYKNSGEKKIII